MSSPTDPGAEAYEVRPFSKDWVNEITRLQAEVVAVRDKVSRFYLAPPDPDDAALESAIAAQVAPYGLPENDRHKMITDVASAVGKQIQDFADLRSEVGNKCIWLTLVITGKLGGVLQTGLLVAMEDFRIYLRDIADRLANTAEDEMRGQLQDFMKSQPVDSSAQLAVGKYALACGLAGRMIDAGNAFLNLDVELRAALRLYADGTAPQGWRDRLPAPLRSVFGEATWEVVEESLRMAGDHGLAGVLGPFSAIPILAARITLGVRHERARELHRFRRNDVDELLDLADQLTRANEEAARLRGSIDAIILASASAWAPDRGFSGEGH